MPVQRISTLKLRAAFTDVSAKLYFFTNPAKVMLDSSGKVTWNLASAPLATRALSSVWPSSSASWKPLMLMVPKNWKELQVTYMPTFALDKTLTFTMKAADVIRG